MRNIKFQTGEYYHIYNRGVNKRDIFLDKNDYLRFLRNIRDFNNESTDSQRDYEKRRIIETESRVPETRSQFMPKLVEFVCYCLNPNHYHFLLRQLVDKGMEKFMHKLGIGYVMYFNQKYDRSGPLFEGRYKARYVENNSDFIWLSSYINGNPEIHSIAKAKGHPWSSYLDYLGKTDNPICNKKEVLSQFESINEYQNFVNTVIQEVVSNRKETK